MTNKTILNLYIDRDIVNILKQKGINISKLVEEQLNDFIKLDIKEKVEENFDIDKEIFNKGLEIEQLKAKKKLNEEIERKKKLNEKKEKERKQQELIDEALSKIKLA